jgi:succinate dehydrogenase/fumarate reductase flavoprotein subunit
MPPDDASDSAGAAGGRVSRRTFLGLAGVAGAALSASACAPLRVRADDSNPVGFDFDADVVVVGSGAAGLTAALYAAAGGARVRLLEKAPLVGGTTAKSGGVYWIPNHPIERAAGLKEPREVTLRAMCRASYPVLFDASKPRFGLPELEYSLIEAFYDRGADAVTGLEKLGALTSMRADVYSGPMPDYFEPPDAKKIVDRRYWAKKADGSFGLGDEMIRQLKTAVESRGIPIMLGHRATRVYLNSEHAVVGIQAQLRGTSLRVRARRGVIFASGGFTHDAELVRSFQPGPVFGGCAVPTNEGDFVRIGQSLGAKLGNMASAWRAQIVLEQALQFSSTPDDVFMPPGDSMILVNRLGVRAVDEKANYNERSRAHYVWDPVRHEWINLLLFMIYDSRTAELFGGRFPLPAANTSAPYVIQARDLAGLSGALDKRLAALAPRTGGVRLDPGFARSLSASVSRFNAAAQSGVDPDFSRGARLYDREWHTKVWSFPNPKTKHKLDQKNATMHAFASHGPYYAIILAAGTLDTNGGPVIDASARVLDASGVPIPGLFAAGNCAASPTGPAYYAGGGTLGPAVTFGCIAGEAAAREPEKELG